MIEATLCFVLDGSPPRQVLLGRKKRGFGEGKFNGLGGKVQPGETPISAIVREVAEEAGVVISSDTLHSAGTIRFFFPFNRSFDHHVHVFTTRCWKGDVQESAEMAPAWFPIGSIPYERMWADDAHWLPLVLSGRRIEAEFTYAQDNETIESFAIHEP